MNNFQSLVGREITGVYVSDDKLLLKLEFKTGNDAMYSAEGDCCSSSWIESVSFLSLGKVRAVEFIDADQVDHDQDEVIEVYGVKILFSHEPGELLIEFRNSSNGYYGGWLEMVRAVPIDTVWKRVAV